MQAIKDRFWAHSAELITVISTNISNVAEYLYSANLISQSDLILKGANDHQKVSKLLSTIQQRSKSFTKPGMYLMDICSVLQKFNDQRLQETVTKILGKYFLI